MKNVRTRYSEYDHKQHRNTNRFQRQLYEAKLVLYCIVLLLFLYF